MRTLGMAVVGVMFLAGMAVAQGQVGPAVLTALEPANISHGVVWLRDSETIQKELKLSDEQKEALVKLKEVGLPKGGRGGGRLTGPDLLRDPRAELEKAATQFFTENLTREQRHRLMQVVVQRLELVAFIRPEIQEALRLTDAQKTQIDQIRQNSQKAVSGLSAAQGVPPALRSERYGAESQASMAKVMALLAADQKAVWAELIGAPFDTRSAAPGPDVPSPFRRPPPAENPGGPAQRQDGDFVLLTDWAVQEELRLTEDQRIKVGEALTELNQVRLDISRQGFFGRQGPGGGFANMQQEQNKALREASDRLVTRILAPAQRERFRQVMYQVDGLFTFAQPEVLEALRLTDDQKATIAGLEAELQPPGIRGRRSDGKAFVLPVPVRLTPAAAAAQFKLQKESAGKVVALLTAEQKMVWEKLIGPPFEPQR